MDMTDLGKARSYFSNRLRDLRWDMVSELETKFGLNDERPPNTPTELVDRIKAGRFVLPKGEGGDREYYGEEVIYAFQWRDPATVKDQAGFEAAKKRFEKKYSSTLDTIQASDEKGSLALLQAFTAYDASLPN